MRRNSVYQGLAGVLISLLVAAAAASLMAFVVPHRWGGPDDQLLGVGVALGAFAGANLAFLAMWQRGRWRPAAVFGSFASVLFLASTLALLLDVVSWPGNAETVARLATFGLIWMIVLAVASLLTLARLPKKLVWVRYATQGLGFLLAVLVTLAAMSDDVSEPEGRLISMIAVLSILGGICVPVLHWTVGIRSDRPPRTFEALRLTLVCPRCGKSQELEAGSSRCGQCGLRFRIEIEEERCPKCGYLTYRLTSSRCPECGAELLDTTNSPTP
jgi:predicted Zn-ribbon and HTH transcriptional regulator